eukprot:scaffold4_cov396-Prasinococcus_capsulatus_cf.AAC.12
MCRQCPPLVTSSQRQVPLLRQTTRFFYEDFDCGWIWHGYVLSGMQEANSSISQVAQPDPRPAGFRHTEPESELTATGYTDSEAPFREGDALAPVSRATRGRLQAGGSSTVPSPSLASPAPAQAVGVHDPAGPRARGAAPRAPVAAGEGRKGRRGLRYAGRGSHIPSPPPAAGHGHGIRAAKPGAGAQTRLQLTAPYMYPSVGHNN